MLTFTLECGRQGHKNTSEVKFPFRALSRDAGQRGEEGDRVGIRDVGSSQKGGDRVPTCSHQLQLQTCRKHVDIIYLLRNNAHAKP